MKRSPSGTPPRSERPRAQTVLLLVVLAVVLAFAASAIFGLRRTGRSVQLPPPPGDSSVPAVVPESRVRVEVLNGAGTAGLAKLATEKLRFAGFDVVQFGNARKLTDTSSVLDRVGNIDMATAVGRALGIANVATVIDTTRYVDATVVLGKDWPPKTQR